MEKECFENQGFEQIDFEPKDFGSNDFAQNEYEQEWQSVRQYDAMPVSYDSGEYNPEYGEDFVEETEKQSQRAKRKLSGFQRTVKYQLIICALLVIAAVAVKFISADLYQTVKSWYYEQLDSQIIITDVFNRISGNTDEI